MSDQGSPTLRRHRLGRHLRELREAHGITAEHAGLVVDRSASWISRVELGRIGLRPRELGALLDLYRVTEADLRSQLERLASEGRKRAWWSEYRESLPETYLVYLGLEAEATRLLTYEAEVVPGLLQSERYARAVHEHAVPPLSHRLVEDRVAIRMRRQQAARGRQVPLIAIVDESVLHRPIGDEDVLKAQLDQMLVDAALPYVDLRVVPMRRSVRATAIQSFTLMEFEDGPRTAYIENRDGGRLEEGLRIDSLDLLASRLLNAALNPEESLEAIGRARQIAAGAAPDEPAT